MITIINYKAGNIGSLKNAIKGLGFDCEITSDPKIIRKANKVIFPGQGRAGRAMKELKKRGLDKAIKKLKVPFLGICLGMQLLSEYSGEDDTTCLGIIPGKVKKFSRTIKVPQIGWNSVILNGKSKLTRGIKNGEYFYFVNSYYLEIPYQFKIGVTSYGVDFCSIVQNGNFYGTQFHPEKSGDNGLKLLNNFCSL